MSALTGRANLVLDAFDERLLTADDLRAWAEGELLRLDDPHDVPEWLLDLLRDGPQSFADRAWTWRERGDFRVRFAMRALRVDLADRTAVEAFARWLAGAAIAQDLSWPEVELGYRIDDALDGGDVEQAVRLAREELPGMLASCRTRIAPVAELVGRGTSATPARSNRALPIAIVAAVVVAAAVLWFAMGPAQIVDGRPDDAWWVLAGPWAARGPGWELGNHLVVGAPDALQLGSWGAHVLVAWLLRRSGVVRRSWPVVVGPALVGQAALIAGFVAR